MAECTEKNNDTAAEATGECTRRESDFSDEDVSDAASLVSSVDSAAEDMFPEGDDLDKQNDSTYSETESDSDASYSPPAKRSRTTRASSSSSSEDTTTPSRRSTRKARGRGRGKGKGRGRGRGSSSRQEETQSEERWCGVDEPDITPPQPTFRPARPPGLQHLATTNYSALQLFQLFFSNSILQTIVNNTNEHGRANYDKPSTPWADITLQDMFSYLSVVIYMGFVKCSSLTDYWRGSRLYSLPYPQRVITGKKFLTICHALHLSSTADDAANDARRGTAAFDHLGKIKPLYNDIRDACRRNYHPGQEISIDERMVASKARVSFKQYMKSKPVRWGFKLFVLADSHNGYTWDFFVYEGKSEGISGKGLGYDCVMRLMNTSLMGTGYKLFVDNFYTSPALFQDLLQQRIWACGTINMRTNRVGYPRIEQNALDSKSPRGSIRWIRTGSLLFVKWRDTRDVFLCSTMHTAHGKDTVKRKVRDNSGRWTVKNVPVPPAITDYNRCMGGVDLSDALIGYYQVLHKTRKWYKTFFYHFVDIAVVNAFLLHKDLCKAKGEVPMHQKTFRETLAVELSVVGTQRSTPAQPSRPLAAHHKPVHISASSTHGRLKCRKCHAKTPVKCSSCEIPLCFTPARDCYNAWHAENNM
ncbi:piggyBac transposable element-derived protein 4 [Toxotes jaculatrix]|uniref:piggyBac transposable element-derived protein 4 n=1 Tax=Toxotes jaculatrix TaxID=941984 RepID=UPI001B3A8B62|nr:piggyBac transposable element-derived protein 4 [Toxotes jaculatrix]